MDALRHVSRGAKVAAARQLRQNPTPTERHAWTLLRKRQILGYKFRRQHILHGFIVDFYCHELRLVLELEGAAHSAPGMTDYDAARAEWLRLAGYRVIRISNRDVTRDGLGKVIGQVAHQPRRRP